MKSILNIVLFAVGAYVVLQLNGGMGSSETSVAGTLAPGNEVVMYSLTTCGYCKQKRQQLTRAGIPFQEHFIDSDNTKMQELNALLTRHRVPPGSIGTPTLVVNGELLVNNPGMDTIRKHLRYKTG
jgi:glutaredoxin